MVGEHNTLQRRDVSSNFQTVLLLFSMSREHTCRAHLMIIESSISSAPALRLLENIAGMVRSSVASTTVNCSSGFSFPFPFASTTAPFAFVFVLSFFTLSVFERLVEGSLALVPASATAVECLRFFALCSVGWDMAVWGLN